MRQLKAAKAEKAIVTAAVAELLELKKRLAAAEEAATAKPIPPAAAAATAASVTDKPGASPSADLETLTRQVAEQVKFELIRLYFSAGIPIVNFVIRSPY